MRITPTGSSLAPGGPPPTFHIETGHYRYFAVQVATHAFLLNGAAASRRTQSNYFDSWYGDDRVSASGGRPVRREVAGEHLEAPTGRTTYTLPQAVWNRLQTASQLYYRLVVSNDERLRQTATTVPDVSWARAPSISIARLPMQPPRSPVTRFPGKGALRRDDFVTLAKAQVGECGLIQGRDGNFRFVVLDANCYQMTVVECHEWGLTDTVDKMPRKPDAVINGQFLSGTAVMGIGTQGQVIREGDLINTDTEATRYYIAQTWRGADVRDYHVDQGDPAAKEPNARAAFGGLGPVLLGGAPVTTLTPWARSIYDLPADRGRGVIAIHRDQGLILLLVQEDLSWPWSKVTNAMKMADLRARLDHMGFDDAIFNDGSDSEALFARGSWLLTPGLLKDEAMDFAIGFVDRRNNRRFSALAIDGTTSADGETFIKGIKRPLITHYSPRNISDDLSGLPALSAISATFKSGIIQAWGATTQAQANVIGQVIQLGGYGGFWADILYVSSHAWRHGQLWYHKGGGDSGPILMLADLWSAGFRPIWRNTPRWLIIAGCAVLGLRYSRGLRLDSIERAHLVDWHHDMHGPAASVPGLTPAKKTVFEIYHPGWAWYQRIFRSSGLRGVLGYWYRSPGGGRDVDIMQDFTGRLVKGETILNAWEAANRRGWFQAEAAWAAMIREGCENDTLATLEDPRLTPAQGAFRYYDRFQRGRELPDAYRYANRLTDSSRVGSVAVQYNGDYDRFAIEELQALSVSPTPANFLEYNDGIGP